MINKSAPRCLLLVVILFICAGYTVFAVDRVELSRLEAIARNVMITRDDWGIAHVVGKTDADAIFGGMYAQAEDDFNRIETNFINSQGRLAEAEGESAVYKDLRMKIFIDPSELKRQYAASPLWLKKLMDAWADGLNFYLAKHPEVKPRVITHFEPWMALSFSEGSIGGDIETVNIDRLKAFYDPGHTVIAQNVLLTTGTAAPGSTDENQDAALKEPSGSNGFAISPKNTKNGHALLLINPHTSFFFRSELQWTSGEGLNVYGASTWGQFFAYQGFNAHCGWMHTSSAVDAIDEFAETIEKRGDKYFYKHGNDWLPVTEQTIYVPYRLPNETMNGGMASAIFRVYRTQHGPIVRKLDDGRWISVALMNNPAKALEQSFIRTKARTYAEFRNAFELHTDSSNNTIYADSDGNIAYFHGNYIPRRDPKFDWTKPVDGSDPATDYNGLLSVNESPNLLNPASGWLYNSNDWPWAAAGPSSRKREDYPRYVDNGVESARGRHSVLVLKDKKDFTLDSLRDAAYDSYLTWFDRTFPALIKAWDQMPDSDPLRTKTADQIAVLRTWDHRWAVDSVPTSLAIFWAESVSRKVGPDARISSTPVEAYIADKASKEQLLGALIEASNKLMADFGTWRTAWGDINRFQRITDDIVHPFTDEGPSIPVGFTSGNWGSIASFGANSYKGSKRIYGTSGNSFVAVVEFGKTIHARAVTAGGESGHPDSRHFNDEAERYATGNLREVYFYPSQLKGHTERVYHPGQ
ncbi:MAG: penicillin acylase family protein [Acidobacteria bacterium]|nr:penicillin acylase family protein [Acidobacteriota bacterium]